MREKIDFMFDENLSDKDKLEILEKRFFAVVHQRDELLTEMKIILKVASNNSVYQLANDIINKIESPL